jgi:glycosyltransferase involved in cell wall biosynthesis
MKILYTSPSIDPVIEKRHFLPVAQNLAALGNDLLLLVPRYHKGKTGIAGLKCVFMPARRDSSFGSYLLVELARFIYFPFLLAKFKPDIIYNRKERFDIAPPLWSRMFGVPYVVEVNGMLLEELEMAGYPSWLLKIFHIAEIINYKLAARVVCVSAKIADNLVKNLKLDKNAVKAVANGADTDFYRPLDKKKCRQKIGLEIDCFYVGFLGSFNVWQDLATLVKAAALVKKKGLPVRFILAGSGEQEHKLKKMAKELSLTGEVLFPGWIEHEKTPFYLNSFDICYVSRSAFEPEFEFSPLKLYEYLACGRPVIASRTPGIKEVVQEGDCGFIFESGNVDDLAQKITQSFHAKETLEARGMPGRRLVQEKYSWKNTAININSIFDEIAGGPVKKRR